jgi:hypothetical protein
MSGHPISRALAIAASAAMVASLAVSAAPPEGKPDKGAKAEAKVEAKAEHQARVEARAEAKAEKQAAKVTKKAEKQAAKAKREQTRAKAKDVDKALCKDGGWEGLVTAEGDAFKNQGECVKYAVRGGTPTEPTPLEAILAIAYTDLDGNGEFDTGDVLIAKLVDENDDGVPSVGDTIHMGQYPKDSAMTEFAPFGVTTPHAVTEVLSASSDHVSVKSSAAGIGFHEWRSISGSEAYYEETRAGSGDPSYITTFIEVPRDGPECLVAVGSGSPGAPTQPISPTDWHPAGDASCIEVDFLVPSRES